MGDLSGWGGPTLDDGNGGYVESGVKAQEIFGRASTVERLSCRE